MSEVIIGATTRDMTGHAGRHAKDLPAGTLVEIDPDGYQTTHGWVNARVVGHPRIRVWVIPGVNTTPAEV